MIECLVVKAKNTNRANNDIMTFSRLRMSLCSFKKYFICYLLISMTVWEDSMGIQSSTIALFCGYGTETKRNIPRILIQVVAREEVSCELFMNTTKLRFQLQCTILSLLSIVFAEVLVTDCAEITTTEQSLSRQPFTRHKWTSKDKNKIGHTKQVQVLVKKKRLASSI